METILPNSIPGHLRAIRAFLTQDEINRAEAAYAIREKTSDLLALMKLRENQPWIEAFRSYARLTLGGRRSHRRWPASLRSLVVAGLAVPHITLSMSSAVRKHHRANLLCLNGNHAPCLAEWSAAYFYARQHRARIEWGEPNKGDADFVAVLPHCSFEVECKRYGSMIVEKFGESEADALATAVREFMRRHQVHGVLTLEVKTHPDVDAASALAQLNAIVSGTAERFAVSIVDANVEIHGSLIRSNAQPDRTTAIDEIQVPLQDYRRFCSASHIDGGPANYRLVQIRGPRRSPSELFDYLLEKLSTAATRQLSAKMGGVLVVEFARVDDATVFRDTPGVNRILDELFGRHRHVAAVVLRAAPSDEEFGDRAELNQFAYVQRSAVCAFPAASTLNHLGK